MHDQIDAKLLRRLQLKFSHLSKHKFCHKFKDCVSPMCNYCTEIETTKHFFLALPENLHDDLCLIDPSIISFDEESLYGSDSIFRNKFLRFNIP